MDGTTSSVVQREKECALLPGRGCVCGGEPRGMGAFLKGEEEEEEGSGGPRRMGGPTEVSRSATGRSTGCFHFSFVRLRWTLQ